METQVDVPVMTNKSTNTRGIDLRRRSQFGLWMWHIVFECLISLPCVISSGQSVSIYPEGTKYVLYGTPLEIICVTKTDTADDLDFHFRGKHINSEKVNVTTRRLYTEHLEIGVYTYYCKNTITNKIAFTRVVVNLPPLNVADFECISKNIEVLNCTWTSPEFSEITSYLLTFLINGNKADHCAVERMGKSRSCSWTVTSNPRYRLMEDQYHFQLTSVNPFGSNTQNFTIDHFSIVKPAPPEQIKVLRTDAHSALLQWRVSNNIYDFLPCGVVHKIEYRFAKTDNNPFFYSVDTSNLPPRNRTYTFLLLNLPYANTPYEVRVYIKTELATEDKFWSDFSYVQFTTASEKPQRPPETAAGAFVQAIYENKRIIYVYWQQLEEYEEAGGNFSYKVVAKQGSKNPETVVPDKTKSSSYVILKDATLEAIDVYIWSNNVNGSSVNSSHLYIPSKIDTEGLKVSTFTKLAYENGTYKLSWVGIKRIDNYTLFWCQLNTNLICKGRMNFTVLDSNQDTYTIDLPRDRTYQFAISANIGSKTSGMTWTSCDISGENIPLYGFPVKLVHDPPGNTYVKISWIMPCILPDDILRGFLIKYCPVLVTRNVCDTTFDDNSIYISNPKKMEINITDLKPDTTYRFNLEMNTTYGTKIIDSASVTVTTLEEKSKN